MQQLQLDEFLRSLKQNIDMPHSLLLGAGASIESGVQSATECIWYWKKEIYLSQNPGAIGNYSNSKLEIVRQVIQKWIDSQNGYPALNSDEEYSFFAEKAYPLAEDRRKYFQHMVSTHDPSLGYHIISMLAKKNIIKCVWTTNFDGLMAKCAHQYTPLVPIEITSETSERVYRNDVDQELLCIALHGDYKYGSLKNTENELDTQDGELEKALRHQLQNRDLIVIGYSGRDLSLMRALEKVYSEKGAGRLFWCGYGSHPSSAVSKLIDDANTNGRSAYYIPTEGFDSTLFSIARHCMSDDKTFLTDLDTVRKQLSVVSPIQSNSFILPNEVANKAVVTNAYPITFPKQCYIFEVNYKSEEKPWDYCKFLYQNNIMAVPYKGLIYAWGRKEDIENICQGRLKSSIELCPIDKSFAAHNGTIQELILKTITSLLGINGRLGYSKDKLWDTRRVIKYQINKKTITGYQGVQLSLQFDVKYCYLTFAPSYTYADEAVYSKEEKKAFADYYNAGVNNGRPNKNTYDYISNWVTRVIGNSNLKLCFPIQDTSPFIFNISCKSAMLGVNFGRKYPVRLSSGFSPKRIVFTGRKYNDPTLLFYNPSSGKTAGDFHPMRGLINNGPIDLPLYAKLFSSSIKLGVICPKGFEQKFYSFICGLNLRSEARHNPDYLISFPGFFEAFKTGVDIPAPASANWVDIEATKGQNEVDAIRRFCDQITRRIDQISTNVDVVLIYIPKEFEVYTAVSDGFLNFDLHDHVKAFAAQKQIATQFIREKTIESDLNCQIMWALSLAIYVKAGRTPWTISGIQPDTAFAGIGYSILPGGGGNNIVIGCSHVYTSDGLGMKYKLSKLQDVTIDKKHNPYLSENEAYRLGLNIKELFYKSFTELPKRVVIHKRTPFRNDEIKGLVDSLSSAGIQDVELIEITYEDDLKCFALNYNCSDADAFPVLRGLCFPLNNNTMYLYTHGISPSVKAANRKYFQGGKSVPLPLKVIRHYGSSNMAQIANEILGLSRMNWNSFNLYSKLPCTIESSNQIAQIGWMLSQFEGSLYDYRFFM